MVGPKEASVLAMIPNIHGMKWAICSMAGPRESNMLTIVLSMHVTLL